MTKKYQWLLRNPRKTVAGSSAPPQEQASSFLNWWRAAGPFALCVMSGLWLAAYAQADVIAVAPEAFPAGSTILNFSSFAVGTEVNGLTANGVQFAYTIGGSPTNGAVRIDQGPGITNHITIPNILSVGDNTGVLSVNLPSSVNLFGYGYAIFSEEDVANATRISVFNGTTPVGSVFFFGTPDPIFTGGFAGIQSTTAFNRLELTFNSVAPAFALDNLIFANTIPEPSTLFLAVLGFGVVMALLRNTRKTVAESGAPFALLRKRGRITASLDNQAYPRARFRRSA